MYKTLTVVCILVLSSLAQASDESTCKQASEKVNSVIEEWYFFVRDFNAESKNTAVLLMYSDFEKGELLNNFENHCIDNWGVHKDIFTCFSGIVSEIGAAMCFHPETNLNGWSYW